MKEADCPNCFDGTIKTDGRNNFFCCACYKEVTIPKFIKGCKNYIVA